MIIKNADVFTSSSFIKTDIEFAETITSIGKSNEKADIDARGCYVIPGLVEIHSHGAIGEDFSDGSSEGVEKLASFYASNGITSFCATTMTLPKEELSTAVQVIRDFSRNSSQSKCAGIHLEGPFFSYGRRGAQAPDHLKNPDMSLFDKLYKESGEIVKIVSVAPELSGSEDFIKRASKICTVALGHTETDYDTAMQAFKNGASHVTHLFNCMSPFLHRAPGVVGAAFDSGATIELISDGIHLHPSMIRSMFTMFKGRAIPISDSVRCAGMPDGEYTLGGQKVFVKDSKSTLADGTIAGSSINLMTALKNIVSFGIPLEEAVASVTQRPAEVIGMQDRIGSIETGKCADFVILDKEFNIKQVIINGIPIK